MWLNRVLRAGAVVAVLALAVTACGGRNTGDGGKKLTVGIKFDQPGIGLKNPDGTYSGLDVDVAKYIANKMGVAASDITFKQAASAQREDMIQKGDVDLVIASYSITDARKQKVSFAGPYFIAGQSLLVRKDNTDITGAVSLDGKKLCSAAGSTSAQYIQTTFAKNVQLQQYGGYSECLTGLLNGAIDAISTDDAILAGYSAANPGKFKLVGKPFTTENYGVGMKKGDTKTQQAVDQAIEAMEQDGSWASIVKKNLGADYQVGQPPVITEK